MRYHLLAAAVVALAAVPNADEPPVPLEVDSCYVPGVRVGDVLVLVTPDGTDVMLTVVGDRAWVDDTYTRLQLQVTRHVAEAAA
jgi:hypothetical protein